MKQSLLSVLTKKSLRLLAALFLVVTSVFSLPQAAQAFPIYAQQAYDSPREANGRIVCANCHLAAKPTQVEVPQAVLPDTVFEAVIKIPYDTDAQQVLGSGDLGPLNVGAVLMLPDGFQIAPDDRIPEKMKEEINGVFYQKYKPDTDNVIVVGPLSGADHQEIIFPVLSPDPATDPNIHFGKYSVHAGGNRGRGQIYPTGDKTNVNAVTSPAAGLVSSVSENSVTITTNDGQTVTESIPAGLEVVVSEGQAVADGAPLSSDPNVGGFGQKDTEIVLQSGTRIKWLMVFFSAIMISQTLLVLKKKQVEKVQAAEMNF
ncbi:cytochrome f [Acaryochloris marina]|uniref:Cytochrome f n=1 Tax=Acaryochloris marina (strain MBIC 11017) TaxID=329726 RepID=CYF_ACAM1|nr:apocytochrome f [Acaryochloris marina]B0CFX9.1 RecName: Full=Cytochrome f; Flags: Precursor [Acaryochloris marina MBIC11017]ABW29426.1 cytochrome f subunit of cytochrome b6f complex PetA [Acaryochloris marina MBIC11017]BDM78342.1 cytochrome f [Acaryochloris marina MBIC10699]